MTDEAKAKALRMLEKRDLSRRMLIDRLKEKGITPEDAEDTADSFCALGVINDERYAGMVVRHYAGKGYGKRRITEELYRHGIDRELWDTALEEMPVQDEKLDRFIAGRFGNGTPDEATVRKTAAALLRRGYSYSEIRCAMERYGAEVEEE